MFNTKRLVENIREEESDVVYRRLLDKWLAHYMRRMLLREAAAKEGGEPGFRNAAAVHKSVHGDVHNPISKSNRCLLY